MSMLAAQDEESHARLLVRTSIEAMISTAPAERAVVEDAVGQLYDALERPAPAELIWADGPLDLARSREAAWPRTNVGGSLTALVNNKLARSSHTHNADVRGTPLARRRPALSWTSAQLRSALASIIDDATSRNSLGLAAHHFVSRLLGRRRPADWLTIGIAGRSQIDAPHFCCDSDLYARYGTDEKIGQLLSALSIVSSNCGWIVPHEHACWLCERPVTLKTDDRGRLHSRSGPALRYRDGLVAYAWKGIVVPAWTIERSENITLRTIIRERDPFVRRCMIEIMTPAKFIASGAARVVSRDSSGTLWMFNVGMDNWAAVEVVNGTAEPDGSYKHYFLQVPPEIRTARQAVAWTYDLTEREYHGLAVRT